MFEKKNSDLNFYLFIIVHLRIPYDFKKTHMYKFVFFLEISNILVLFVNFKVLITQYILRILLKCIELTRINYYINLDK